MEELDGKLSPSGDDDKLLRAVIESDKETLEEASILNEMNNYSMSNFCFDEMMSNMDNMKLAKKLFGKRLLREITGYDTNYIEKNINIPEFKKEMGQNIMKKFKSMRAKGLIEKDGTIAKKGFELAALFLYVDEMKKIKNMGVFSKESQKKSKIGEKADIKNYQKGDSFKQFALKESLKLSLRRGHKNIIKEDLRSHEIKSKPKIEVIFCIDSSGSMKGPKIDKCRRAAVSLAYKAIEDNNQVGLVVFGKEVYKELPPSKNLGHILQSLTNIKATSETNLAIGIKAAKELFVDKRASKHIILVTDALPTAGDNPVEDTMREAALAGNEDITISLVGIGLEKDARRLAMKIIEVTRGRLYNIKTEEDLDYIIMEDYGSI